jgi:hypothetical protein
VLAAAKAVSSLFRRQQDGQNAGGYCWVGEAANHHVRIGDRANARFLALADVQLQGSIREQPKLFPRTVLVCSDWTWTDRTSIRRSHPHRKPRLDAAWFWRRAISDARTRCGAWPNGSLIVLLASLGLIQGRWRSRSGDLRLHRSRSLRVNQAFNDGRSSERSPERYKR